MSFVLEKSVDIELLIEGSRRLLFEKITKQKSYPPSSPPDIIGFSSQTSKTMPYPVGPQPFSDSMFLDQMDTTATYLVRDSCLTCQEDELVRVFEVEYLSSLFSYYAFGFKGYIICPAFLSTPYGLTNYACLNVINGSNSNYSYIFFKQEPGNPLSDILGDSNKFISEYIFELPSESHRVLSLHSTNKDIKCFIDYDTLGKGNPIRQEWNDFMVKKCNLPQRLSSDQSYWFVPLELMSTFISNHQVFFRTEDFCNGGTSLVHKNSHSFAEIDGLLDSIKSEIAETEFISKSLQDIFTKTEYKRENYNLESLLDHIKFNYQKGKDGKLAEYYCPMIAILQSSGYGKSKLMERLGSQTPTFYSSLQYGAGYPRETFFLSKLIDELDSMQSGRVDRKVKSVDGYHMNNFSAAVYIHILRILYIILKKNNNKALNENFQIDNEIESYEPFDNIPTIAGPSYKRKENIFGFLFNDLKSLCESDILVDFDGTETLELKEIKVITDKSLNSFTINSDHSTDDLERDVMDMLKDLEIHQDILPSIFVIDEARGLRYRRPGEGGGKYSWKFLDKNVNTSKLVPSHNRAPYNVFRRAFRIFKNLWERLILIVISTSGQISVLFPELELDPSRREATSNKFMDNFVLLQTYNVNSESASSMYADMFPKRIANIDIKDWMEFIYSAYRIEEFFKFGRPLIYGTFVKDAKDSLYQHDYDLETTFQNCKEFWFLSKKLFGGKEYHFTKDVPLLYSMFNFAFGTHFLPPHVKKEDLVENYLMTLVKYFDEKGESYVSGCFLPEGAFNALSAKYFIEYPQSIQNVLTSFLKYGLCNTGHLGELLAQYILLKTAFSYIDESISKIRKLVFRPIPLIDFLFCLTGNNINGDIEAFFSENPFLRSSLISFSYFEPFTENPINCPFNLMARCLFKGSAVTLNNNFRGIDLMVPLILNDGIFKGKISFLGIQVKFVKMEGVKSTVNEAVDRMTFSYMFNGNKSDRPIGLIVLALGNYGYLETDLKRRRKSQFDNPAVLVFVGIPDPFKFEKYLFNLAPRGLSDSYRDVNPDFLEACDRVKELIMEMPPIAQRDSSLSKKESIQEEKGSESKRIRLS